MVMLTRRYRYEDLTPNRSHWRWIGKERPRFAETPAPGQESVWDFPRPPALEEVSKHLVVRFDGVLLADSTRTKRICETAGAPTYYFPPEDVRMEALEPSMLRTYCEWKGEAAYWTPVGATKRAENAVWAYPEAWPGFEPVAGWLAFHPAHLECEIDGVPAMPQPGGLYGGWVTPDLAGPIKGGPGSSGW